MNNATRAFLRKSVEFLELSLDDPELTLNEAQTIQEAISNAQVLLEV
jgi:hypothetical protein